MLDCFEGIESSIHDKEYIETLTVPLVVSEEHREITVKRYSERHNSAIYLTGIEGMVKITDVSNELLDILAVGELVHIGKNTSFGFGRYQIKGSN